MKHSGKATQAGLKLILWSLLIVTGVCALGIIAEYLSAFIASAKYYLVGLWAVFALFTVYFFRDPNPKVPNDQNVIVSPGHGTIDVIDEIEEPEFMGGRCRRISMFLSPLDVHVQNAPFAGNVSYVKHHAGQYLNAMRTDSAKFNENVLIGIESAEIPGRKLGVRVIAGLVARRIVPWVKEQDRLERGDRIGLVQFGSRCDLYLPMQATITVRLKDKVKGGETVVAKIS